MKIYYIIASLLFAMFSAYAEDDYQDTKDPVEFRNEVQTLWVQQDFDGLKEKLGGAGDPWEGTLTQLYHRVRLLQRDGSQYEEAINGLETIKRAMNDDVLLVSPGFMTILDARLKRSEKTLSSYQSNGWTPEMRKNKILLERQWKPSRPWDDGYWSILIQDMYLTGDGKLVAIQRQKPNSDFLKDLSREQIEKLFDDPDGSSQQRYASAAWLMNDSVSKDFEGFVKDLKRGSLSVLQPQLRGVFWEKYGSEGVDLLGAELLGDALLYNDAARNLLFILAGAPEAEKDRARKLIDKVLTQEKYKSIAVYGARLSSALKGERHKTNQSSQRAMKPPVLSVDGDDRSSVKDKPIAEQNEQGNQGKVNKYWIFGILALLLFGGYVCIKFKK